MGFAFVKGHGTENDFVLLPDLDATLDLTPALVARICDRRAGLGADGVLRVVRAAGHPEARSQAGEAEWFMDYRNADGSAVEMCGNGIRVFARYLVAAGLAEPGDLPVATRDGVKKVRLQRAGDVTVDMGVARFPGPDDLKVSVEGRAWPAVSVDMGNPHAVVFVDRLADAGSLREAPTVDPAFPEGVNVEFVTRRGDAHVAMRVHERGVGETRSCGTGACAVMVAAVRRAESGTAVRRAESGTAVRRAESGTPVRRAGGGVVLPAATYAVDVPGGRLTVTTRADGHVELAGPAVLVARGELTDAILHP